MATTHRIPNQYSRRVSLANVLKLNRIRHYPPVKYHRSKSVLQPLDCRSHNHKSPRVLNGVVGNCIPLWLTFEYATVPPKAGHPLASRGRLGFEGQDAPIPQPIAYPMWEHGPVRPKNHCGFNRFSSLSERPPCLRGYNHPRTL